MGDTPQQVRFANAWGQQWCREPAIAWQLRIRVQKLTGHLSNTGCVVHEDIIPLMSGVLDDLPLVISHTIV